MAQAAQLGPEAAVNDISFERARPAAAFLRSAAARFAEAPFEVRIDCAPELTLLADQLPALSDFIDRALTNTATHGFPPGQKGIVWISLTPVDHQLRLRLRDNGAGVSQETLQASDGPRMAAIGEELGGYAKIGSAPFTGNDVQVIFPVRS
jgi:two-component sensor histidine kinase